MKIIGHRGAAEEWPENTLKGFVNAIESGVNALEIDIHKSSDNQLMVIHDPTLERTTNGNGFVAQQDSAYLRTLDAGQGEKIPFLHEVLDLILERKVHLFIEVKAGGLENELVRLIQQKNAYDFCTVICFNHFLLKQIKALDPKITTGCLLVGTPIDIVRMVKDAHAEYLILNIYTTVEEVVTQCRRANIQTAIWTANTEAELNMLKALSPDFVMTDKPSLIVPLA
ncbi:MAG: hypothetical protein KDD50_13475 [Bdellovibrionales bacterium]|nr:hypothetical protein [Bdellovibrionales bacterium]